MRYGYGSNRQKGIINLNNFIGYNSVDDPATLSAGYLVSGSQNIDISRSRGGLPKVLGRTALITSLGSGGIKGLHTYRADGGDIPLFGWGTDCYKLTGATSTITKTTTADFNAGASTNVSTASDMLSITDYARIDSTRTEIETPSEGWAIYATNKYRYTLTANATDLYLYLDYQAATGSSSFTDTVKLLNSSESVIVEVDVATSGYKTIKINGSSVGTVADGLGVKIVKKGNIWRTYRVASGIDTLVATTNYAATIKYIQYEDEWVWALNSLTFYAPLTYNSGSWLSPVYDLSNQPKTVTLDWNTDDADDTAITVKVRGSSDNTIWGDWETITTGGGSLPRKRYLQVMAEFKEPDTVKYSVLTDFTITYTFAYNTATSIKSSLTGNKIRFCDYNKVCYFADGGNPMRYDGTSVLDVGVTAPSTAPTMAASATAGNPSGTYYCKVTFVNEYGAESNASPASASVTVSGKQISWSSIPTGGAGLGIEKRKLYRTKAGGAIDGDYYYVATIEDNTTTTYADNLADSNLITVMETDNNVPPNCNIVWEHKNYMMYATENRLYHSKVGLPDSVPPNNYKEFPDDITGVQTYQDYLIVQGKTFSAVVYGDIWDADPTIDDTSVKILNRSVGAVSQESMAECYGSSISDIMVFPTYAGMTYLDLGTQDQTVRGALFSEEVQNIFDGAIDKENMAAIFNNYLYMVAMCYYTADDTPVNYNNIIMTYDLRRKKWYPPITYGVNCFCLADGEILAGDSALGIIYQMNTGTTDNGGNIHAIALTSSMSPQNHDFKTKFTRLRMRVNGDSVTDELQIKPVIDGEEGVIDVGSTSLWQAENTSPFYRVPLSRGYELQLKVEDDSTNDWIISGMVIEYEGGEI